MKAHCVLGIFVCCLSLCSSLLYSQIINPDYSGNEPITEQPGSLNTLAKPDGQSRETNTWDGSFSTAWGVGSNWSLGTVPNVLQEVVIIADVPRFPIVSAAAECNNLWIDTSASLTISAGSLTAAASCSNFGTLSISTGTLIIPTDFWNYGTINMINSSANLVVNRDLFFDTGCSVNINVNAEIYVTGNIEFRVGSNVNMANGTIITDGSIQSNIRVYETAAIYNLYSNKSTTSTNTNFTSTSDHSLTIKGNLTVGATSKLYHGYPGVTILQGNLNVLPGGICRLSAGALSMEGNTATTFCLGDAGNYLNNLVINKTSPVIVNCRFESGDWTLDINGNFTITSGSFIAPDIMQVAGYWTNNVGPDGFIEGTGLVVFKGNINSYFGSSEVFNNLELNKSSVCYLLVTNNSTVTCDSYDWTAGILSVNNGTFTALEMVDDAIQGTVNLISGRINFHNDSYTEFALKGNLNITGGELHIFGGYQYFYLPSLYGNATLTMSGGIIDVHDVGISINTYATLITNITGGIIRAAKSFYCTNGDFNPDGGTLEMYDGNSANLKLYAGSLHNLVINKTPAEAVSCRNPDGNWTLDINGDFTINSGGFIAPNTMQVAGDWFDFMGPGGFEAGTGTVVFDGAADQQTQTENFYTLGINKSSGALIIPIYSTVTCDYYDWTAGTLTVSGGTFTANEMLDDAIRGTVILSEGQINFYNDTLSSIGLEGNLNISGGELHLYGGFNNTSWPGNSPASITMSDGVIDVHDIGIWINVYNTLTTNITGGIIRTAKYFHSFRSDFNPDGGTLEMYDGNSADLRMYAGSLHNLVINKTPTEDVSCRNPDGNWTLDINGDFTITSGSFIAPDVMQVAGDWTNNVGPDGFIEGTGLVIFNGSGFNICHNETFNDLVLNKIGTLNSLGISMGSTVTCNSYDWTAGELLVDGGTFTALEMADDAIRGTVNLRAGHINFHNDVTSQFKLEGALNVSGGELNIYGGDNVTVWPGNANASITMSNGLIDIHDTDLSIIESSYSLLSNITGGTIRAAGDFYCEDIEFNPSGGTLEMYSAVNANIIIALGSLYNLTINKPAPYYVTGYETLDVNGDFTITSGSFIAPDVMQVAGNWTNSVGSDGFVEGTGTVTFDGSVSQTLSSEDFYNLTIDKDRSSIAALGNIGVNGDFYILSGFFEAPDTMTVAGNWTNDVGSEGFWESTGTVVFTGSSNSIVNPETFYNLVICKDESHVARIISGIIIYGDLTIQSGGLDVSASPDVNILIRGNWTNLVGTYGFLEGINSVVIFNGQNTQTVSSESFHRLKLQSNSTLTVQAGSEVNCVEYEWVSGTLSVIGGTFNVDDLYDYSIRGNFNLSAGQLNFHNNSSSFNYVSANLNISGGELHVYGGSVVTILPGSADASLIMSGGVLDVHDSGITISNEHNFSTDITGGTIRTAHNFVCNRNDFNPTGGTLEMYAGNNAGLRMNAGSLHNLTINKYSANNVTGRSPDGSWNLYIRGNFTINSGTFIAPDAMIVMGNWINNVGPEGFTEGTGSVYLTYYGDKTISSEGFYNLYIDKWNNGSVTALGTINVGGYFTISQGVFVAPETMTIAGNWANNVGASRTDGFIEGTGNVTFNGTTDQTVSSENFNRLILNKSSGSLLIPTGSEVACNSYDWEAGSYAVPGGSFTVSDLVDDAVLGEILLSSGSINYVCGETLMYGFNPSLTIQGGTFNLDLPAGVVQLCLYGPASLTMSGGMLDFHNSQIDIYGFCDFNDNITGGTIRTCSNFNIFRSDFTPIAGLIELYGSDASYIYHDPGSFFYDVTVNKAPAAEVYLFYPVRLNGILNISSGVFNLRGFPLYTFSNIFVDGTMKLPANSLLTQASGRMMKIRSSGLLEAIGTAEQPVYFSRSTVSGYYGIEVESGGTLSASHVIFEYMDVNGLNIKNGALVDASNSLNNCTFRNGYPDGILLTINNAQDFTVYNAQFPANDWGSAYNVSKSLDQGTVLFSEPGGDFRGEDFDNDIFNRINWQITSLILPPVAEFSADFTEGLEPLTVQFTDLSEPGSGILTEWLWDFGDATNSTEQNPQHMFVNDGLYTVSLTVTNVYDSTDIMVKTDYINVIATYPILQLLTQSPLAFGMVFLGSQSAPQDIMIQNTGTADLVISSISFTSGIQFDYTGLAFPVSIPPGETGSLPFVYAPHNLGSHTDDVFIYNNSDNQPVVTLTLNGSCVYAEPKPPENVTIDMDGSSAIISWDAVTETIYNTPIVPDGYLVFFNGSPDPEGLFYFLTFTNLLSCLHFRVGEFSPYMFYHVRAYKSIGRAAADLTQLGLEKGMPEAEVLKYLNQRN
jgi:PKD repeat protein